MFLAVQLVELRIGPVFAHPEGIAGQHIQHQIQSGLTGDGIHLVFEDTGETPILRGVSIHLDFTGDTIGDVANQFEKLGVRVLVPFVFRDKFGGHFRHITICLVTFVMTATELLPLRGCLRKLF